jgi:hypothetical protein
VRHEDGTKDNQGLREVREQVDPQAFEEPPGTAEGIRQHLRRTDAVDRIVRLRLRPDAHARLVVGTGLLRLAPRRRPLVLGRLLLLLLNYWSGGS